MDCEFQFRISCLDCVDHGFDLSRIRNADGIAKANACQAGVYIVLQKADDLCRIIVLAFKGAAKGCRKIQNDFQVRIGGADFLIGVQRLLVRAVDVCLVMAHAERNHIADLAKAESIGIGSTAQIGDQCKQISVGILLQYSTGHISGIRHLGNRLGTDERGKLHTLHAGFHQPVNNLQLLFPLLP